MSNTLKNALKAGGVAGGGLFLVLGLAALVLGPALIAVGWFLGWWSFEAAVIVLLLIIAYIGGGAE